MKSLIAVLALTVLPLTAHAGNWPMFMGNTARTGQVQETAQVHSLKLSWQHALHAPVSASPVVADGRLYVAAEDGNLHVFDLKTRRKLWLYHSEGAIASTPAVADGRVHFLSRDGFLHTLSTDGKLLWRFQTGGEHRFAAVGGYGLDADLGPVPDPWDLYQSSPLIHDGKVYFGSSDGHVYALDAATGKQVWAFAAGAQVHSPPAYVRGRIFVGTWGTKLYALDAATGAKAWDFQGGTDPKNSVMEGIIAAPSNDGEMVYAGARDGFVYAFDIRTGALKWKYDAAGSWVLATAAIDDDRIYFGTSDTNLFVALDKRSGREAYRIDTQVWTYASPVLAGNTVFVATMSAWLYALDKRTGQRLWSWQTPESQADVEDIVDEVGKLRADKLFAPNQQLQASVERVKALGAFAASPIWVDGQLIAVTATGDILMFTP